MGMWARRTLALVGVFAALLLGPVGVARADTASPSPTPSAVATAPAEDDGPDDAPDVPLDETRTILMLAGAGALALLAGIVVFVRH